MYVDARSTAQCSRQDFQVGAARETRMDAALQAHLGRAACDGFRYALGYLAHLQLVAGPAERACTAALGKSTEAARITADVRVVDVAIDDIRDVTADRSGPQLVCRTHDGG